MDVGSVTGQETRRTTWSEVTIIALAVLNALAAFAGAWGLVSGALELSPEAEARLPLASPVLGGLTLALFVGVPNLLLAWLTLLRHPLAALGAVVVGVGMIGWILVELAFIRELSFFHPLYVVVGALMIVAGRRGLRPS